MLQPGRPVIIYDDSRWPYVVVTQPSGELGDAEFAQHLAVVRSFGTRGSPFALVLDVRLAPVPNATRRRMMAELMSDTGSTAGGCFGVAVVLSSAPARAVFTAIMWIRRATYPFSAVSSVDEALRWLAAFEPAQKAR